MTDQEQELHTEILNAKNTMTGTVTTNPDGTVKDTYAAQEDTGVLDNTKYSALPFGLPDTLPSNWTAWR